MEPKARTAQQLVEHQFARARLVDRSSQDNRQTALPSLPVITISREVGARGSALGAIIASRFGFSLWGQQLVHLIAAETGAQAALVESLDEHARNGLEDLINGVVLGTAYTQSEYLRGLERTVGVIGQRGSAVLIGRGAHFILDPSHTLRVRAISPYALRVLTLAEQRGSSLSEARHFLERTERERDGFFCHHFGREIADPAHYDVVVNTGALTLERAADIVISTYCAKFGLDPRQHRPTLPHG